MYTTSSAFPGVGINAERLKFTFGPMPGRS
jgi:hypothetical protein